MGNFRANIILKYTYIIKEKWEIATVLTRLENITVSIRKLKIDNPNLLNRFVDDENV